QPRGHAGFGRQLQGRDPLGVRSRRGRKDGSKGDKIASRRRCLLSRPTGVNNHQARLNPTGAFRDITEGVRGRGGNLSRNSFELWLSTYHLRTAPRLLSV